VRAKEEAEAAKLVRDAHLLSDAGCFGIVLEKIPAALAARVTSEISAPTIGIGAGNGCDGQVLVIHDMLGINKGFSPRFLRRYADLYTVMSDACRSISRTYTYVRTYPYRTGRRRRTLRPGPVRPATAGPVRYR